MVRIAWIRETYFYQKYSLHWKKVNIVSPTSPAQRLFIAKHGKEIKTAEKRVKARMNKLEKKTPQKS